MAIFTGDFKKSPAPGEIVSRGVHPMRKDEGALEAEENFPSEILQEDPQRRSASIIRMRQNLIPKWTKVASSLTFPKMTKRDTS
jgi:hypothetical protein